MRFLGGLGIRRRAARRTRIAPGGWEAAAALLALGGLAALLQACASDAWRVEVAGREIYHHNWWNYYERGRELLLEGNAKEAMADFETSLGLRPGAKYGFPRDMWRARTYGLHFVEAYFPHRELGVAYLMLNRVQDAIRHLETSLRQEPSGRAKYYLNAARARALAGKQVAPPAILLDPETLSLWTRERVRPVSGLISGKGYVKDVSVNGKPLFIELAAQSVPLVERVTLKPGTNEVTVSVRDLAGQKASRKVVWVLDREPPRLTVLEMRKDNDAWLLRGLCSDDFGLAGVRVAQTVCFEREKEIRTAVPVTVRFPLDSAPVFVAEDLAGNRIETAIRPEPQGGRAAASAGGVALAWNGAGAGILDAGGPPLQLAVAETPQAAADRLKPSLRLGNVKPVTDVFREEFFLDGEASDGGGLASVRLNGEELLPQKSRGAVRSYFARRLALDPGTNRFDVTADDMAGNRATQSFVVVRRQAEYMAEEYRLSVGLPPLRPEEEKETGQRVKLKMEEELLRDPRRFHLLERDEGWDFILREQKLSLSDLADPKAALQIGKMLPAELLLMGTLMKEGGGTTVHVKVVETGDGRVLLSDDVFSGSAENDLDYQVEGLVMKVEQHFPLVSGQILSVAGAKATINVGSREGVGSGTRFVVISRAAQDADIASGRVLKVNGQLVQLDVKRTASVSGTGDILPDAGRDSVKEGDHVYAR